MANVPSSLQPSKSVLIRSGVVIAGICMLAFVLPIIYKAFLATLGLLGLGITGGIGFVFLKAIPFFGQNLENKLLGLRKAQARSNPIEQLQNNLIRKANQLSLFKAGLETIGGQIGSLETSLREQAQKDPDDDLSEQIKALTKMKEFYQRRKDTYVQACKALEEYKKAIERAKFKFGFGAAAQGIAQAMNDTDAKTLMENMLADEAFKSVDQRFNTAFAALDLDSAELTSAKSLDFNSGGTPLTIDFQSIQIPVAKEAL